MSKQLNNFEKHIRQAINDLKGNNYIHAEENIKQAMFIDANSSAVQNLYGILNELLNQNELARKHYLAATVFDPTYKPTTRNLERIATYYFYNDKNSIDYGNQIQTETKNPYVLVYDDKHVGHLIKKETEQ